MSRRHYLLRDEEPHEAITERLEQAFDALKHRYDLVFAYAETRELGETVIETYLEFRNEEAVVQLVHDPEIPARYVIVEAADPEDLEKIGAEISRHLPVIPVEELREHARRSLESDPSELVRLAVGAPETADEATAALLREALRHPQDRVRDAAAMAAGILRWPELAGDLHAAAEKEQNAEIRSLLAAALASVEQPSEDQQ